MSGGIGLVFQEFELIVRDRHILPGHHAGCRTAVRAHHLHFHNGSLERSTRHEPRYREHDDRHPDQGRRN